MCPYHRTDSDAALQPISDKFTNPIKPLVTVGERQGGSVTSNDDILTVALQIHSVAARHAAEVRKIGGKAPWDTAFDQPTTKEEVLAAASPFLA